MSAESENFPPERDWAYELWVHLSDHVNQKCEPDEPDDCEHCRDAEVDCDDCRSPVSRFVQSSTQRSMGRQT